MPMRNNPLKMQGKKIKLMEQREEVVELNLVTSVILGKEESRTN